MSKGNGMAQSLSTEEHKTFTTPDDQTIECSLTFKNDVEHRHVAIIIVIM